MTSEQESPEQQEASDPEAPIDGTETLSSAAGRSAVSAIRRLPGQVLASWRPIVLTAVVVASIGLAAGLFLFQYRPDREIDNAAAQQAIRAASDGAVAALSYSPASMDRDLANAKSHLTGDFLAYYSKFTQEIVAPTVRQTRLSQKAAVIRAAVSELHPDHAVVLEFINETTTSKDKKQPLVTPSIVRITLTKVDGSWLISKLDPL
jgi:Mce-associated membrane protein